MVIPHITITTQSKEMEKIRWPSVILGWLLKMCSQTLYSPKPIPHAQVLIANARSAAFSLAVLDWKNSPLVIVSQREMADNENDRVCDAKALAEVVALYLNRRLRSPGGSVATLQAA